MHWLCSSAVKRQAGRSRRGSVIILVLGTILLVAVLATQFIAQTGTELVLAARNSDQSALRREAYSAMEVTLAVLADFVAADGALFDPSQGWAHPLDLAGIKPPDGMQVEVLFEDETGKLSLPTADAGALRKLFESCGLDDGQAQAAAEALLDWSRKDQVGVGPSEQMQVQGNFTIVAPKRPLRTFDEMASIDGLRELVCDANGQPNEIWQRLTQTASLHSFSRTNVNTATPATLRALGWAESQVTALESARSARGRFAGYAKTDGEMLSLPGSPAMAGQIGVKIEALRVKVTARSGGMTFRLDAVVMPRADQTPSVDPAGNAEGLHYPFRILEFQENPEPIRHAVASR